MPNKVNPVITEMVSQVSFQVICCDQAITLAAFSGQLELNAFLPLITYNLLWALKLLKNCATLFRTHCVEGIQANPERCTRWLEESLCLATSLAPYIGHEKAAEVSRKAATQGETIRQIALQEGLFSKDELDIIFSTSELTRPGIAGLRKLKHREKGNK
jgi:aspartate ammonia-lyase